MDVLRASWLFGLARVVALAGSQVEDGHGGRDGHEQQEDAQKNAFDLECLFQITDQNRNSPSVFND